MQDREPEAPPVVLNNTYVLGRELGRGAYGVVYEAEHRRLPNKYAVKIFTHERASCTEAQARFEQEAWIASTLCHPSLVEIVDFDSDVEGRPYIVMELLEGETLEQLLDRYGALDPEEALEVVREVCAGVGAAHQAGVVHRDLKPSNIFICRDGAIKVMDFGVSKLAQPRNGLATSDEAYLGTPGYMAPEQADGRAAEADERTDVYAVAVILFKMLSGQLPIHDVNPLRLLYKIVRDEPRDLQELRPDLPSSVVRAIDRALSKHPGERQASLAELADALAALEKMAEWSDAALANTAEWSAAALADTQRVQLARASERSAAALASTALRTR